MDLGYGETFLLNYLVRGKSEDGEEMKREGVLSYIEMSSGKHPDWKW